jgi:hypothetical protein
LGTLFCILVVTLAWFKPSPGLREGFRIRKGFSFCRRIEGVAGVFIPIKKTTRARD